MKRFLFLLASVLAILVGIHAPASAIAPPATSVVTDTHCSHHISAELAAVATQRGPPAASDITSDDAVDRWSHGASVCLGNTARSAITTYAYPEKFARGGSVAATTSNDFVLADEDFLLRSASKVATKSGDDLIRLSSKESWANLKTLDDHFVRHGADFGATSADDYARMGSEFFQRGGAQHLPTKIAPDGTIRMYDPATNTFGSFAPNGMTKTLFKPTSPSYWSRQPGVLQ